MFKALDRQTGEEIIILDAKWIEELRTLRELDRADILICQGCKQPVRVRAGSTRRWHFAHKHLENCPYDSESPALVEARAVLYEWLVSKFGNGVTLEKDVAREELPRHVDCWVRYGNKEFAYWIIEKAIKPDERECLQETLPKHATYVNWVFTIDMLRPDENKPATAHLTTTERLFLQSSMYDVTASSTSKPSGKTLHYLDAAQSQLTTFRNLVLVHSPQVYSGTQLSDSLPEVLVSPTTGEFVYQGEYETLQTIEQKQKELEQQRLKEEARIEKEIAEYAEERRRRDASRHSLQLPEPRLVTPKASHDVSSHHYAQASPPPPPPPSVLQEQNEEGICVFCGRKTRDWWYFDGATGECKCRDCFENGKS